MKIEKYIEKLKQIEAGEDNVMLPYNIIRKMEFLQGSIYVPSLRELLEEVLKTYDDEQESPLDLSRMDRFRLPTPEAGKRGESEEK